MKLLTRLVFVFLTAFVLVTAVYARRRETDIAYPVTGGNIYFNTKNGIVTDCDGTVTKVAIPNKIDGVSVTAIGSEALARCKNLTSAVIPYSVTSIKASAFRDCTNLTSVTIPNSVISIGDEAFYGCSSLTNVEIPNSVTSIGLEAFKECANLTSVKISNSVTSIKINTFEGCTNLTSVEIPNSVTSIGWEAFSGCTNLTSVKIPNSVTFIGNGAFAECVSLTNVNVEIANKDYLSLDGVLFNKSQTSLICYPAGKSGLSYQIPASVISIKDDAFSGCTNLTSVKIPNSIISIGCTAFWNCPSLTSVEIPNSVTTIGDFTFKGCDSLRDVYYMGTKAQWEKIKFTFIRERPHGIWSGYRGGGGGGFSLSDNERIFYIGLSSKRTTIHYNASMPEFTVPSAPTVGGRAISKADLSGLTEISVPLTVSADTPANVTVSVPFFDGGKFVGMGFVTANVDKTTQSVTLPVTGDVSGAGKLNVIFLDADFRPLSATAFDIAA